MSDRIEKTIEIAAPVERVWSALTDHQQFGEWFKVRLDEPFVAGRLTRGEMTYPGFEGFPWVSRTEVLEAPRLFVFDWPHAENADDDLDAAVWTRVEFRLEPAGEGTRLTIVESGFDAMPEAQRLSRLRDNTEGWDIQARNVKAHAER